MYTNDQFNRHELSILLRELEYVLKASVPGDVVELGCYKGATSVELQKLIGNFAPEKRLYLYDSFAGLPFKTVQDMSPAGEQFRAGELPAIKREVLVKFRQAALPSPVVKKAWFSDLSSSDMPANITFAFLDGDFYESIKDSLKLIWPNLSNGSVVVVDDYQNESLPGVQKSVDEWLKTHTAKLKVEASLAIIYPSLAKNL